MIRTIAHISDLHFGRVDPAIAEALLRELHDAKPSVVVVSGDFTQRARSGQYRAAAAYLRRLPEPRIVVPGNHDIPLYDVVRRFLFPLTRYRRFISEDLQPLWRDQTLLVLGINTARSFTRTGGHITAGQLEQARQQLGKAGDGVFKVVVTHHPFIPAPNHEPKDIVEGAKAALEVFEASGVDLLLSGHLHLSYCGEICAAYPAVGRSMLAVQAGTATSTRRRGEPNGYNFITIRDRQVEIEARSWDGAAFGTVVKSHYSLAADRDLAR
jgi:3',5'-cyclic AMP phosphodiesterase CpdA